MSVPFRGYHTQVHVPVDLCGQPIADKTAVIGHHLNDALEFIRRCGSVQAAHSWIAAAERARMAQGVTDAARR